MVYGHIAVAKAAECEAAANRAKNATDRAKFEELALHWRNLAKRVENQGCGQPKPDKSNTP
jgi:hypothetical protein